MAARQVPVLAAIGRRGAVSFSRLARPVSGSLSETISRNEASSMGRSDLPSQLAPSGTRFWTLLRTASTCSKLASAVEMETGIPRGSCVNFDDQVPVDFLAALLELLADAFAQRLRQQLLLGLLPVARVVLEHVERLDVDLVARQPKTNGSLTTRTFVPIGTDSNSCSISSGIEAQAAVARAQADAGGLVGAVDHVAWPAEIESVATERIVGAGTDHRFELLAVLAMLLDDRWRRPPGRDPSAAARSWSCPPACASPPCRCRSDG